MPAASSPERPAQPPRAASSYDVLLGLDRAGREPAVRKDVQRHVERLSREPLREEVSDGRGLLKAVAGESARAPGSLPHVDGAQDGRVVGRDLIQPGPGGVDAGGPQSRRSPVDHLPPAVPTAPPTP